MFLFIPIVIDTNHKESVSDKEHGEEVVLSASLYT